MSDVEGKGMGPYLINKVLIPLFQKTLGTKFKRVFLKNKKHAYSK